MALVLNEDWTADVVGRMHKFRIKNTELAEKAEYDPAYTSTVLNGSKKFGSPEAAESTKQRILSALAELEKERMAEVEHDRAEHGEDQSDADTATGDGESGILPDQADEADDGGSED